MSTFILFMMFFVSPPAKPGKQVWALSHTAHLEFETMSACIEFGKKFQQSLASTATTTVRGWCVSKKTGGSTADKPRNDMRPESEYYEIPALKGH